MYSKFKYTNNNRFGFAAPFLLGAITGGAVGYAFPRPQYNNYQYPVYPYTYYYY